ncbi:MAG: cyclase family protein [Chitinophagales bacterium]|nr:cyclase family protein [Chitinophagales bacterium]
MIASIQYNEQTYKVDLSKPMDISLSIKVGGVKAWYVDEPTYEPVKIGNWIGDVKQGGSVNFRNVFFNPHGHGTHTECVGHISKEDYSVNNSLKQFHFIAQLISVLPEEINDDFIITKKTLEPFLENNSTEAIIIRTLSNSTEKIDKNYSNTNPSFIDEDAMKYIVEKGFNHVLLDTPSVDKEQDGGKLLAHHAFWQYPENTNTFRTITELVFINDEIKDGIYLLNLQVAAFENDAAPSRPVLFQLI